MIGPERSRGGRLAAHFLLIASTLPGCSPVVPGPVVHPVSGFVFVDGKPASGVELVFHPVKPSPDQANSTIAITAPDGRFMPSTRLANDGVPAGDYMLTATWRKVTIVGGEEVQGADRLRGTYSDPRTSALRATIREGDNLLPRIDLTSTFIPNPPPQARRSR